MIFPEGRITVTGSLMKVYDGAALIADKSDAMVVPVRIEGPEHTVFSRLKRSQVRRQLFPKIKVTILEPVQLKLDPELKGRKRRQAAGSALYTIMSDLIFRTTPTDRTIVEALIEAAKLHGPRWIAVEDPVRGQMSYRRLLQATAILGRKLMPYALESHAIGVMLPTSNAAVITLLATMSAGRVPALINFTAGAANVLAACRAAQVDTIVTSRTFVEKGRLENLIAQVQAQVNERLGFADAEVTSARPLGDDERRSLESQISRVTAKTVRATYGQDTTLIGGRPMIGRRFCSPRAWRARPRASCCPIAICWPMLRRLPHGSISVARTNYSTCCRCSIRSD